MEDRAFELGGDDVSAACWRYSPWLEGTAVGTRLLGASPAFTTSQLSQTLSLADLGRETVSPDGSLHIAVLNFMDTGPYTTQKITARMTTYPTWNVYLSVFEKLAPPTITASMVAPVELQESVTLSCQCPSINAMFQWYIDKELMSLTEYMPQPNILAANVTPMENMGSVTLMVLTFWNITRNDTGLYQCEASNSVTSSLSNLLPVNMNCFFCLVPAQETPGGRNVASPD
ncbi:PREDICTED: carcinoembryonic antigen-related cell adhesion molecule 21-like [Galeopterus variegatus]|uniref:Carcinoembryonic antigen-related cell adhesion molecule 21-like n=1 Tax=Galeopterus variegatus TaxID=482537 RepID=A0ABM0RGF0_GALVR|nr:PREDICTED: carcinoembryonic antigen-related cell adhesion molecule 21-like [Galeopterus variegatus]